MINLKVQTEDFEGNISSAVCQFHLTKTEITELDLSYHKEGGLESKLNDLKSNNNPAEMFEFIKELMIKAYGVKSEDGKSFLKSKELTEQFRYGYVLPECLVEIMKDENGKGVFNFMRGIVPKSAQDAIAKQMATDPTLAQFK